jgi:hypothetical protein
MRPNVKQFVQLLTAAIDLPRPVVDIGALRTEGQEGYADLRPYFDSRGYTGWDMRGGPGVDGIGSVHHLPIASGSAGTVLMLDTLEHVLDPIASMLEVCRALRPGGVAVISSHMNFPIHAHPSDYWRFTPMAFNYLMRPLATRSVFMQGNAENPHNVMAAGINASGDAAEAFRAAMRDVQARWGDNSYGGPLVLVEPAEIDVSQRSSDRDLPELVQGRVISQSFRCGADGLNRIDVKMANRAGRNERHVIFRLYDESQPDVELAAHRILGWHVEDDAWVAVPVPVQAHSAGRRYVLTVEAPDGLPGNTVSAKGSASKTYADGELRIDATPVDGSMCFQAYCAAPPIAAGDVQAGEQTLGASGGVRVMPMAPYAAPSPVAAVAEQQWQQVRYLASTLSAELDAIREQIRAGQADLLDLQRQTLHASAEKLLARSVRENPASRALRKLRGKRGE